MRFINPNTLPQETIAGPRAPQRAQIIKRELLRMQDKLLHLNRVRLKSLGRPPAFFTQSRMKLHVRERVKQLGYLMEAYQVLGKK